MPRTSNEKRLTVLFITAEFQNTVFKEKSYRKETGLLQGSRIAVAIKFSTAALEGRRQWAMA